MRSLRRVLLQLVLLAGVAFRGVRFDDAADAAAAAQGSSDLFELPSPSPTLALPGGGDEGASTEIIAAPWPGRHGLFTPPRSTSQPARAVVQPAADFG